jgi:hypothetical protein
MHECAWQILELVSTSLVFNIKLFEVYIGAFIILLRFKYMHTFVVTLLEL